MRASWLALKMGPFTLQQGKICRQAGAAGGGSVLHKVTWAAVEGFVSAASAPVVVISIIFLIDGVRHNARAIERATVQSLMSL